MKNPFTRDLTRDIQRAERAERILNDPDIKAALDGMEETLFHNFKTSKYKDKDEREEIYRQLQSCRVFREKFESWIREGKDARLKLDNSTRRVV